MSITTLGTGGGKVKVWIRKDQPSFFDLETQSKFDEVATREAKIVGMNQAAESKTLLLAYARKIAVDLAGRKGEITADDVQLQLAEHGISIRALGNAAGSLFKGKGWVWTGKFNSSKRVHSHGNLLRVWRLK